jgi:recombination protein RecA
MTPAEASAAFELPNELPKLPKVVSTGSLGLDLALGIGGWPLGQVSVIYGPAWCGKTTLALSTTAQMQKLGTVAYICLDGDFHPEYATAIGVDVSSLLVLFDIPPRISGFPLDFLVVDSLSFDCTAEQVAEIQADHGVTALAVSQTRSNITRGCDTPGFLQDASVRVRLSQDSNGVGATVTRNPWLLPNQNDSVCFKIGDKGIDHTDEVLRLSLQEGLIHTQGSWLYMGGLPLGQGKTVAQRALQEHPGLLEYLEDQLRRGITHRSP